MAALSEMVRVGSNYAGRQKPVKLKLSGARVALWSFCSALRTMPQ